MLRTAALRAELLELVVEDDRCAAYGLGALRRPPRLTPEEGFQLAAASRALLGATGAPASSPLARALGKLEAALGESHLQVEIQAPQYLERLRAAVATNEVVEIDYLGRDSVRGRRPVRSSRQASLLSTHVSTSTAFCRLAGDWRRFQVSRIPRSQGDR